MIVGQSIQTILTPYSRPRTIYIAAGSVATALLLALTLLLVHWRIEKRGVERNRAQLAAVVQNSGDAILSLDLDGRIESWNTAAERLFGFAAAEAIGRRGEDLIVPADRLDEPDNARRVIALGESVAPFDTERRAKDGRMIPVSVTMSPVMDAQGRVSGISSILRDITERKRAEQLLRARLVVSELAQAGRLGEVVTAALNTALDITQSEAALFHRVAADEKGIALQSWSIKTPQRAGGTASGERFFALGEAELRAECVRRREAVMRNDCAGLEHDRSLPQAQQAAARVLAVPLIRLGKVSEIISVQDKASDYVRADVEALAQIALLVADSLERARSAEALAASEARFRQLAEVTFEGIAISDRGILVDSNAQHCAMLGYERSELIGKSVLDLVVPEYRAVVAESISDGSESTYETMLRRKDGTDIRVLTHARIMQWQGKPLRVATLVDITDIRRTEAQLRKLSRAVEQSPASILITDREGAIEYVNPRFEEVTGYARAEVMGRNPRILKAGVNAPEVYADLWRAITAGGEWRGELCNRKKDGQLFWEYAAVSGLQGDDGEVTHFIAVKEDITERKRLEEARMRSQKLASLGTLAGGIAHDFNNLLAAIRGNAELAAADLGGEHPAAESLAEIRKAGSRASELVRRIMAFGQPQPPRRKAANLGEVVNEVLKLLRPTLPVGISLRTNFDPDVPLVLADSGQVHEVVMNLTANAVYAIGARPGSIGYALAKADLAAKDAECVNLPPGRYARLTVVDDGCGMDAATLARVFDAFFTTKPVGVGTGLGLSMVYGIMQSHGGAVAVDSAPGAGARFDLYFPAAAEGALPDARATATAARARGGRRVLYLDDEEALVLLATRALMQFGHSVAAYSSPQAALEAFRARPGDFDIIVTDLSMPEMSGFEFARHVHALRPGIPVLMTTGYVRPEDEETARKAGLHELICKPSTMGELAEVLDRVLRSAAA